MHAGEAEIDGALVLRLVAAQFPQWAGLGVEEIPSSGTVNAMFRLGDSLTVRLPRIEGGVSDMEKEFEWLPRFAPLLPVAIPSPVGMGKPGEGYRWPWSVQRWIGNMKRLGSWAATNEVMYGFAGSVAGPQRFVARSPHMPGFSHGE